jgi:hypothetical protein
MDALAAVGLGRAGSIFDSLTAALPAPGTVDPAADNANKKYNLTLLTLDQPLDAEHSAAVFSWDGLLVDLRPEVGYITSNINIRAADGEYPKPELLLSMTVHTSPLCYVSVCEFGTARTAA